MIPRLFNKLILSPDTLKPSQPGFEVIGAFNPGVIKHGGTTYFLIRVAEMFIEKRDGYVALPKAQDGKIVVEWIKADEITVLDERIVRLKRNGFIRLTNISHLRLAKSRDGVNIDYISDVPTIAPEGSYEEFGIEDPRITYIDNKFYITYVAVSSHGIVTALISTEDFMSFERHGVIFPTENKDVVIFPEKVGGNYVSFHRPLSANPFGTPEIWMAHSKDLIHWGHNHFVLGASDSGFKDAAALAQAGCACSRRRATDWDSLKVGAGAPPVRTKDGWLEIYHGSYRAHEEDKVGVYCAGAALFDFDAPNNLIAKAKCPMLIPQTDYEQQGFLPSVVFPTAAAVEGKDLVVYYGAADTYTAIVKFSLETVLSAIKDGCHKKTGSVIL